MAKVKKTQSDDQKPGTTSRKNLKKSSTKIITKDGKVKKKVAKQFTLFKCQFCNKKFTNKHNCWSHEKLHSSDVFPCPLCPYEGKTKKYLSRHHKQTHSPKSGHKCRVCGKMFNYECNLKVHAMVHTGEKPFKCEVCGKAFRVMFSLNSHMLIHKNEKPFKCSFCNYACRDNSTLRKHENRHMGVVKAFSCKICSKKFTEKAKLKYHISQSHLDYLGLDLKVYACDKCDKAFSLKHRLIRHVETVHERKYECRCPVCGQKISNSNNLPSHLRTHFTQRPYKCKHEDCGKSFKDKSSLKKHSMIHAVHLHHACEECGATFSRAHRLVSHARTHRPRGKCVECDYCGLAFYSKNYLIKHIKQIHNIQRKKYICDQCGLVTYNKPSIVMHLKYGHMHDNDLHCKICKTVYKRHEYLKAHYLRTHKMKYKPMKGRKMKEKKPELAIKVEPIDTVPFGELTVLDVHKEEIIDEEQSDNDPSENDYLPYSKTVLSEDLAACLLGEREKPSNNFDNFLYDHVFHKQIKNEVPTQEEINEDQRQFVTQKIKDLIKKAKEAEAEGKKRKEAKLLEKKLGREAELMRRKKRQEIHELEKVRQAYNERMKAAAAYERNKKEPVTKIKYFHQKTTNKTVDSKNDSQFEIATKESNAESIGKTNDCNNINNSSNNDNDVSRVIVNCTNDLDDGSAFSNENDTNLNKDDISINDIERNNDSSDEMMSSTNTVTIISEDTKLQDVIAAKDTNDYINDVNKNYIAVVDSTNDDTDHAINDSEKNSTNCVGRSDSINDIGKNDSVNDDKDDSNDDDQGDSNDDNGDSNDDDSDYEPESKEESNKYRNKRLNLKTHQCYICFKLYPTKDELIDHCQSHFDICNTTTLVKCPVCGHVASHHITQHMLNKHGIKVKIPFNRIKDRMNNDSGSRYCYEMDKNGSIMEIIPSVKILNHHASVQIDKKNRELKEKTIAKTRLVKKGKEWIVENYAVNICFEELPKFTEKELSKLNVSSGYVDRLGQLSRLAKKKKIKMMFPCNVCDKICQNFSALKLHSRRHDPNKKPFAPKRKRNSKPAAPVKKSQVCLENRLAKPKPIINNHKCDDKLKRFYETHIRGADIEFWQFLKIFNKMDRENIQDFKDFEGRTEFGIHTNEERNSNEPLNTGNNKKSKTFEGEKSSEVASTITGPKFISHTYTRNTRRSKSKLIGIKKPDYKRNIRLSKKEHLKRERMKVELREKLKNKTS